MYAFIHIPKTAGTTLRYLFRQAFGARHCDVRSPIHRRQSNQWLEACDLNLVKAVYPQLSGICGHRVCCFSDLGKALPDLKYFTVLRDPARRFVSNFQQYYLDKSEHYTVEQLKEFAADPIQRNVQTRWLCGQEDAELAIKTMESRIGMVGLTEKFDESLLILKKRLNEPKFEINYESLNHGRGKANLDYFNDPYLLKLIEDANEHDIEVYRHVIEERFPRQDDEYGPQFNADLGSFHEQQGHFKAKSEPVWGKTKRNLVYKPLLHFPRV